jgi:GGDEF domain-containing protein
MASCTLNPVTLMAEQGFDRRVDYAKRKRVSEMSREEMVRELLRSPKTGLPNQRAFEESEPTPFVAMADLDGLKAFNDRYGYSVGDVLIARFAGLLKDSGLQAYHAQGDEFYITGDRFHTLDEKLRQVRQRLREEPFAVTSLSGRITTLSGADFSYGIGTSLAEAERSLKAQKELRQASVHLPWGFPR